MTSFNFKGKPPALPKDSLVLVTGANGFLGSHISDQILQAGYRVRGTSRDASKTKWITELFDGKYGPGRFEAVVVKDMASEDAFDEACKDVAGVCHVASVLPSSPNPNEVIPTVIAGAINILKSAAKSPSVKRFVYTSSSASIAASKPNEHYTVSTDKLNDEDVTAAWQPPPYENDRIWPVYCASKTQAERAMWEFMAEEKPSFVLNAVLPDFNFGELLHDKQPASSGEYVRAIYNGQIDAAKALPPHWMVDVKDTGRLHVVGLLAPDVREERILAYAYPFNLNDVLATLRILYPEKKFAEDLPDLGKIVGTVDRTRSEELLGMLGREGFVTMEQSVKENVQDLIVIV